jgi:hypothetical protein
MQACGRRPRRLPERTNTRSPADTRAECSSPLRAARSACSRDRRRSRTMFVNGGGGIRTHGPPNGGQRLSRPRRNDRNAASQLEPASRGNAGGNESQPAVWATSYRQCRRPEDVQLLARVPSRPAACACSEPHCAPPMGKPASGAQQAGLSALVSCGANCASLRVPQARGGSGDRAGYRQARLPERKTLRVRARRRRRSLCLPARALPRLL